MGIISGAMSAMTVSDCRKFNYRYRTSTLVVPQTTAVIKLKLSLQEKFRNRAGPVPNITRRMGRKLKKNDKNIYFLYFFMMNEDRDITWEKHKKRKYLVCVCF